jgi:hypothetical protein
VLDEKKYGPWLAFCSASLEKNKESSVHKFFQDPLFEKDLLRLLASYTGDFSRNFEKRPLAGDSKDASLGGMHQVSTQDATYQPRSSDHVLSLNY